MGLKQIHLVVRGRVQGVFFRATALREARQHGLNGWVRNHPDGSVEMVVEGEEGNVKDFLSWAQTGPTTARVDDVQVRWHSHSAEYSKFTILP